MQDFKQFITNNTSNLATFLKSLGNKFVKYSHMKWDEDTLGMKTKSNKILQICKEHKNWVLGISSVGIICLTWLLLNRKKQKKQRKDNEQKDQFENLVEILEGNGRQVLDTSLQSRKKPMESIEELSSDEQNEDRIFFQVMNNYRRS